MLDWDDNGAASTTFERLLNVRAMEGNWCFHIANGGGGVAELDHADIPVTAGEVYALEGYVWNLAGSGAELKVDWLSVAPAVISTETLASAASGKWEKVKDLAMTAPGGAVNARVYISVAAGEEGWFDHMRFWKAAESTAFDYDPETDLINETDDFPIMHWFIRDAASITALGQREAPYFLKDIAATSATADELAANANALLDSSSARLLRIREGPTSYRVALRDLPPSVKPGDKVAMRYRGEARHWGEDYVFVAIEEASLWVTHRTREFFDDGSEVSVIQVSDQDLEVDCSDATTTAGIADRVRPGEAHPQLSAVNSYVRAVRPSGELNPSAFTGTDLGILESWRIPGRSIGPNGGFVLEIWGTYGQNVSGQTTLTFFMHTEWPPAEPLASGDKLGEVVINVANAGSARFWYARCALALISLPFIGRAGLFMSMGPPLGAAPQTDFSLGSTHYLHEGTEISILYPNVESDFIVSVLAKHDDAAITITRHFGKLQLLDVGGRDLRD